MSTKVVVEVQSTGDHFELEGDHGHDGRRLHPAVPRRDREDLTRQNFPVRPKR
jgi:hypothetical protein